MGISIVTLKRLGDVTLKNVTAWAAGNTVAQRFPDLSENELVEDRMFRTFLTFYVRYAKPGLSNDAGMDLVIEGQNIAGSDDESYVWRRYFLASDRTLLANILPREMPAAPGVGASDVYFWDPEVGDHLPNIMPPGTVLRIGVSGATVSSQDSLQVEAIMAESPDPAQLLPYVGAQSGGLSGPFK